MPEEGLSVGGSGVRAGQGHSRVFITTGWDPRSVEEVTALFDPAIFPFCCPVGFFPRSHFHEGPPGRLGVGMAPPHTQRQGWPGLGFLPLSGQADWRKTALEGLLQNRKLLSLLPEGQELSPWQPWDKEARLTLL